MKKKIVSLKRTCPRCGDIERLDESGVCYSCQNDREYKKKPKSSKMTQANKRRAYRVTNFVGEYALEFNGGDGDLQTTIGDILSDLRHFADLHDLDFDEADRMGGVHYSAEVYGADLV